MGNQKTNFTHKKLGDKIYKERKMANVGPNHLALCFFGLLILAGLITTLISTNWVHKMETLAITTGKPYEQRGLFLKCNALQGGGNFQCTPIREAAKLTQLP